MEAIACVHSDFPGKFGIPRQSGLVDALESRLIFTPPYRNRDALRGLEGFSHIWLLWVFDRAVRTVGESGAAVSADRSAGVDCPVRADGTACADGTARADGAARADGTACADGTARADRAGQVRGTARVWSPTVRPPRLGGNARLGVFATRSPFRPNPIGLSCVRLDRIADTPDGPVLYLRGADLADGTPVLDLKPYVPYADSRPEALGGFAASAPEAALEVEIPPYLLERIPEGRREALYGVLAQDPRPRYIDNPDRVYGFGFAGREVRFTVEGTVLTVREIL